MGQRRCIIGVAQVANESETESSTYWVLELVLCLLKGGLGKAQFVAVNPHLLRNFLWLPWTFCIPFCIGIFRHGTSHALCT